MGVVLEEQWYFSLTWHGGMHGKQYMLYPTNGRECVVQNAHDYKVYNLISQNAHILNITLRDAINNMNYIIIVDIPLILISSQASKYTLGSLLATSHQEWDAPQLHNNPLL